jgi:hypothetical protein
LSHSLIAACHGNDTQNPVVVTGIFLEDVCEVASNRL